MDGLGIGRAAVGLGIRGGQGWKKGRVGPPAKGAPAYLPLRKYARPGGGGAVASPGILATPILGHRHRWPMARPARAMATSMPAVQVCSVRGTGVP